MAWEPQTPQRQRSGLTTATTTATITLVTEHIKQNQNSGMDLRRFGHAFGTLSGRFQKHRFFDQNRSKMTHLGPQNPCFGGFGGSSKIDS